MAKSRTKIRVFYSWQSDLPGKTNRNAIRAALEAAAARLNAENPEIEIKPDEATRDQSGAVNIARSIFKKIERADIFIADITTVTAPGSKRPSPNPNVLLELGYAVGELGWKRVILLFNEAHANLKADLPFDIVQNRVSAYRLAATDPKSAAGALEKLLRVAVEAVLAKNPKRPAELRGLQPKKIRHKRDVEAIRWLMEHLSLSVLDDIVEDLPYRITQAGLWFLSNFEGVIGSSRFILHDPVLKDAVERLAAAWRRAFQYDQYYRESSNMRQHLFVNVGDAPFSPAQQAAWRDIEAARDEMARAKNDLLERLKDAYVEVDVRKASQTAWASYRMAMRDVDRRPSAKRRKKAAEAIKAAAKSKNVAA
ncbi:TIR domain-containing protein [Phenylobacterium sp.]|uniref:TIR domain-containing protein n=1 Tax=Phenylobacterium sp. TaxID=1871053 RepID=UPI0028A05EB9|nr:TIR domain-containing protein [Phenylobacterium sp.]